MVDECRCKDNFKILVWLDSHVEKVFIHHAILSYLKEYCYKDISFNNGTVIKLTNGSVITTVEADDGGYNQRVNAMAYSAKINKDFIKSVGNTLLSNYSSKEKHFCLEPTGNNIYVIKDILYEMKKVK